MAITFSNNSIEFGGFTLTGTSSGFIFDGDIKAQGFLDTRNFLGESFGYVAAGADESVTCIDTIQRFPLASDSTASDVGELSVVREGSAGVSSTEAGYSVSLDVHKFIFSNETQAKDVGELCDSLYRMAGHSSISNAKGFTSGGNDRSSPGSGWGTSTCCDTIHSFPFTSDTTATDVGELSGARNAPVGHSSPTHGYAAGGGACSSGGGVYFTTNYDIIDKFSFSSVGTATDIGELTCERSHGSGQSSLEHGYTSGGNYSIRSTIYYNMIDKFPFASDTNAADVGDTITNISCTSGQSSTVSGYITGGRCNNPVTAGDTIQKFPFAADVNSSDVAELAENNRAGSGHQV